MNTVMQPDQEDVQIPVPELLAALLELGGSDLHLTAGTPPTVRVHGELERLENYPPLSPRSLQGMIYAILPQKLRERFEQELELDMSYSLPGQARFRVNVYQQRDALGAAFRLIPFEIKRLDELGLPAVVADLARFPRGFVVVTGPTGSGKSTTLYAALLELNDEERNIITIEDPVEYRISGVNQLNVNRKAGLTFATGLRSILRADPDVIMVGEIRDAETARIAIESALTGHMVLTTLHTNDAPGAVARLGEMGIESFLTASAVECVVAQRLARQLCTYCKRRAMIPEDALRAAGFRTGGDLEAYEPVGCARCSQSGYKGRIGLFSVMHMSDEIKSLTVSRAAESEIAAVAREQGMLSLREDGLTKVRAGVTSIEEVARISA